MDQEVTVWYDEEGDYLEVLFAREKGVLPGDEQRCGHGKNR